MPKTLYVVVESERTDEGPEEFERKCTEKIREGYRPHGEMTIRDACYVQAFVYPTR